MKITVLVDNNTLIDQYFVGEPAVSYYIEIEDKRILFDTGYSDIFLKNADKMKIDLNRVTDIVLSHGHDDHTKGLKYLLEDKSDIHAMLTAHPDCFLPKYDEDLYIGAPFSREEIESKVKCNFTKEVCELSENLFFLGEIPRQNDFEAKEPIGHQVRDGKKEADYLMDDTALVYKNDKGIFIITGCAHSGICNIVEYAKKVCGTEHILGILGGFHLMGDDERINQTIAYLAQNEIDQLYPCHCVSLQAKAKMMSKLPVVEVGVGMQIRV